MGEFLVGLSNPLPAGGVLEVRTPGVVTSVKGTLFYGRSDPENVSTYAVFSSTISIRVAVRTDSIAPQAAAGELELTAGNMITLPYGEPPKEPEPSNITLAFLQSFALNGSLQGLEKLAE